VRVVGLSAAVPAVGRGLSVRGEAPLPSCGWPGLGFADHAAEMAVQGISE